MASNQPASGVLLGAEGVNPRPEAALEDGSHQQRLERDATSVEPELIPTQRNTSTYGTKPGSDTSGDTLQERLAAPKIGVNASASSSQDYVGEMPQQRVSVRRGKEEFAALERRYSNLSQNSSHLERSNTRRSIISRQISRQISQRDVEKAEDGEFNLSDTLRSGRSKQDEAGIKRKAVGVVWDDFEVVGAGGMKINIRTFPDAIKEQFIMPVIKLLGLFGVNAFGGSPRTIIHKNSGVLHPGQMCLVLGRPGAGCSTFLKTITNQRGEYMAVNGDVSYAGVPWQQMAKEYSGEVVCEYTPCSR